MKLSDLTVEVRDKGLARKGLIRPEELNFELTDEFNNVGSWHLKLQAESPMAEVLREPGSGIIVTGPDDVLFSGPTIKPEFTLTSTDPGGTVSFEGVSDSVVLADMLSFPQPSNPDPTTQTVSHDVRTGPVESVMHAYVNANVGPGAPVERRKVGLLMGADGARGRVVKKSARFPVLGNLLADLAVLDGLGFRVVQRGDQLVFETYQVVDRSRSIRLDVRNNTLAGQKVALAPPGITRAIVAGQGDLVERQFVARDTAASVAAEVEWGRRIEQFIDQRQTDDVQELERAGDEVLEESGFSQVAVRAIPMEDSAMRFGIDWRMGDRVGVVVEDREHASTVTGYTLRVNSDGLRMGAVLGDAEKLTERGAMVRKVSAVESRVAVLERSEGAHTHDLPAGAEYVTNVGNVSTSKLPRSFPEGISQAFGTDADGWGALGVSWSNVVTHRRGNDVSQTVTSIVGDKAMRRFANGGGDSWSGWQTLVGETDADRYRENITNLWHQHQNQRMWAYRSGHFGWTGRIIALGAGRGAHGSSDGWWGLNQPTSGTSPGYGGAPGRTWSADGIALSAHEALYAIRDQGSAAGVNAAEHYAVVGYTSTFVVPKHWLLVVAKSESDGRYVGPVLPGGEISYDILVGPDLGWGAGWQEYDDSGAWGPASIWKEGGLVHVEGLVARNGSSADQRIFTLPAGFRPYRHVMRAVPTSSGVMELRIHQDGNVHLNNGTNPIGWVSISCAFRAGR
jgi:hypothetical protein